MQIITTLMLSHIISKDKYDLSERLVKTPFVSQQSNEAES